MFKRKLNPKLLEKLICEKLFKEKLAKDIRSGLVFPAIRDDSIAFYHKGGRLFSYNQEGFVTNAKYASASHIDANDYVFESDLKKVKPIKNFPDGYSQIKKNCSFYSGKEAEGVSRIYSKYSYAMNKTTKNQTGILAFDIEVAFKSLPERVRKRSNKKTKRASTDRIDLLLYNQKERKLKFYEAKHYSNSEIWSKEGELPEVITQVKDYKRQIKVSQKEILEVYKKYTAITNKLFEMEIEPPDNLDDEVCLLIFGFDKDQLHGKLKSTIKKIRERGIQVYFRGGIETVDINTMWKQAK